MSLPNDTPPESLLRVVVGTAGHIDHGKTLLIRALTGIDCDRWAEEKARGITIDLGFAHLVEDGLQVGFVDVPGHTRFLENALAGLGGIRVVLLVVAATEGVMPQTREHLAICSRLGIPSAIVALTKVDLAEPDLVELATLDIEELLATTPFAGAPILPVSSVTQAGLPELRERLLAEARRWHVAADATAPARLPLDRAFHLQGLGAIVTGTLGSGVVRRGDTLELLPAGKPVRVRSIQVHGEAREEARAGERTSLQLAGVELGELARGMQLGTPGAFEVTRSLLLRVELFAEAAAPLKAGSPIRAHLLASEALGQVSPLELRRLEPGQAGWVELRLAEPLVAARGDRVILRRPTPAMSWGGGEVLDPAWKRRRGVPAADDAARLAEADTALALWAERAQSGGVAAEELAPRLGQAAATVAQALARQAEAGLLLAVPAAGNLPPRWLAASVFERVKARATKFLADHFAKDRLAPGLPKAELLRRLLPGVAPALAEHWLERLTEARVLEVTAGRVAPPGRVVRLSPEEQKLAERILARYQAAGLEPPALTELRAELIVPQKNVDAVLRYLVQHAQLVRLPNQELLAASAFERLREALLATAWERFGVPQFKDHFGLTRKWAIPLLELCDSVGLTKRVGNDRLVVRG